MKINRMAMALVALGSLFMAQSLRADLVQNSDFTAHTGTFDGNKTDFTTAGVSFWTDDYPNSDTVNPVYVFAPGVNNAEESPFPAQDPGSSPGGGNILEFSNLGTIYSNSFAVTSGTTYDVTFWQAMTVLDGQTGPQQGYFDVFVDGRDGGGSLQAFYHDNPGIGSNHPNVMSSPDATPVTWNQQTISFTADSTSAVLDMQGWDGFSTESGVFLSDVVVTEESEVAPLPPAFGLALVTFAGLGAFALVRRDKRSPMLAPSII